MDKTNLQREIDAAFPILDMPSRADIVFHGEECPHCHYLAMDMEDYRNKPVDGKLIRHLHQELSCLSAKGLCWILPHYLSFCLTPEAEYNTMETEFLIYYLSPSPQYQQERLQQLRLLTKKQLRCLTLFLQWCASHPYWRDYCPNNIQTAQQFLQKLENNL